MYRYNTHTGIYGHTLLDIFSGQYFPINISRPSRRAIVRERIASATNIIYFPIQMENTYFEWWPERVRANASDRPAHGRCNH